MSLATRCPDCAAPLTLVPDQLRAAGGWVRCSRCECAFNASAQLEVRTGNAGFLGFHPAAATPMPEEDRLVQLPRLSVGTEASASLVTNPSAQEPVHALDTNTRWLKQQEQQKPQAIATPILRPALVDEAPQRAENPRPVQQPAKRGASSTQAERPSAISPSSTAATTLPDVRNPVAIESTVPSFMRDAAGPEAAPVRRTRRLLLHFIVALLAVALAFQVVLACRDRLAASAPALAPSLRALCDALGCTIRPVRQIDALVIDHSSLNKKAAGVYALQIAIRNRSDIGLAAPAIELTLTDIQDRPVVRRALMPSDVGAGPTIAAHDEWRGAVAIAIADENARIVGYKVLVFYP